MTKFEDLDWLRMEEKSVLVQREILAGPLLTLQETLRMPSHADSVMDHVLRSMAGEWRVDIQQLRMKSSWSVKRTYEFYGQNSRTPTLRLVSYDDGHGGSWIELTIDNGALSKMFDLLDSYIGVRMWGWANTTHEDADGLVH